VTKVNNQVPLFSQLLSVNNLRCDDPSHVFTMDTVVQEIKTAQLPIKMSFKYSLTGTEEEYTFNKKPLGLSIGDVDNKVIVTKVNNQVPLFSQLLSVNNLRCDDPSHVFTMDTVVQEIKTAQLPIKMSFKYPLMGAAPTSDESLHILDIVWKSMSGEEESVTYESFQAHMSLLQDPEALKAVQRKCEVSGDRSQDGLSGDFLDIAPELTLRYNFFLALS